MRQKVQHVDRREGIHLESGLSAGKEYLKKKKKERTHPIRKQEAEKARQPCVSSAAVNSKPRFTSGDKRSGANE